MKYRPRFIDVEAAPDPEWAGEVLIIVGSVVARIRDDVFAALFEPATEPMVVAPRHDTPPPEPREVKKRRGRPPMITPEMVAAIGAPRADASPRVGPPAEGKAHNGRPQPGQRPWWMLAWLCQTCTLDLHGKHCPKCGALSPHAPKAAAA